jgi:predicted nucleic acid-binding protein
VTVFIDTAVSMYASGDHYPHRDLSARDVIHVATCIHEGIDEIVSPDRGFDLVRDIRRLPPEDFAA